MPVQVVVGNICSNCSRGVDYDGGLDRSMDGYLRLRRKLGMIQRSCIASKTVRHRGYLFAPQCLGAVLIITLRRHSMRKLLYPVCHLLMVCFLVMVIPDRRRLSADRRTGHGQVAG